MGQGGLGGGWSEATGGGGGGLTFVSHDGSLAGLGTPGSPLSVVGWPFIGGGGTLNYVAKFTPSGAAIGNSQLFDNGTNVGLGTNAPGAFYDILQPAIAAGNPIATRTTGGALTNITVSASNTSTIFDYTASKTWAGIGTVTDQQEVLFLPSTYFSAGVVKNAATVAIAGSPTYGGGFMNAPAALRLISGNQRIDTGNLYIGTFPDGSWPGNANPINAYRNVDDGAFIGTTNVNAGNNAICGFTASNDLGNGVLLVSTSSTFSSFPGLTSDTGALLASGSGGLLLSTTFGGPTTNIYMQTNMVGINTTSLGATLQVQGAGATSATYAFIATDSGPTDYFHLRNDKVVSSLNGYWQNDVLILFDNGIVTAVGTGALSSNAGGINLTAVGMNALNANTIGNDNTAIGHNALLNNSDGVNNTAIGSLALSGNTHGSDNTAIGQGALQVNGIGVRNTAIGYESLNSNIDGSSNVGIGYNALLLNDHGGQNVAIGQSALESNRSGSSNNSIGLDSMLGNTTGSFNNAMGQQALQLNNSDNNVAIGHFAGNQTTGGHNVYVGANTFINNTDSGVDNIFIGYGIDFVNTFNSCAVIGSNIALTANEQFIIGTSTTLVGIGIVPTVSLQTVGSFKTADPGSGIGAWMLGQVQAGAVTPDAANYLEVNVDGVVYKLIKAA